MSGRVKACAGGWAIAAVALLGALLAFAVDTAAPPAAEAVVVSEPLADPSPSPTLGSTNSPGPNPPGSSDTDPNDYTGTGWIIGGIAAVVVLVGGGTFYLLRTRRMDMSQLSASDADETRGHDDDSR
jgi:hypothetical protein